MQFAYDAPTGALDRYFLNRSTAGRLPQGGLTAARAGYLDNLNGHAAQTGDSYALGMADVYLDTGTTPWSLVWAENGTGDAVSPTVLARKYLYDVSDVAIAAISSRVTKQLRDTL